MQPPEELLSATKAVALSEGIYDLDALVRTFPAYLDWFVSNAFGEGDSGGKDGQDSAPYARFAVTRYPLHRNGAHLRWLVLHSPGDTLVDAGQAAAFFAHLSAQYHNISSEHGGGKMRGGGGVEKDWTTITLEHNDMLKSAQYSDLVGDWLMKQLTIKEGQ